MNYPQIQKENSKACEHLQTLQALTATEKKELALDLVERGTAGLPNKSSDLFRQISIFVPLVMKKQPPHVFGAKTVHHRTYSTGNNQKKQIEF